MVCEFLGFILFGRTENLGVLCSWVFTLFHYGSNLFRRSKNWCLQEFGADSKQVGSGFFCPEQNYSKSYWNSYVAPLQARFESVMKINSLLGMGSLWVYFIIQLVPLSISRLLPCCYQIYISQNELKIYLFPSNFSDHYRSTFFSWNKSHPNFEK